MSPQPDTKKAPGAIPRSAAWRSAFRHTSQPTNTGSLGMDGSPWALDQNTSSPSSPGHLVQCAVGYHVNIYDLSVLLLVTFVVLDAFLPREQTGRTIDRMIAFIAALMFVATVDFVVSSLLVGRRVVERVLLLPIALVGFVGFKPSTPDGAS